MIDAQIIALSITVLAILGATLVNNVRIGDVKEVLRAEMDARFAKLDLSLEIRFNAISAIQPQSRRADTGWATSTFHHVRLAEQCSNVITRSGRHRQTSHLPFDPDFPKHWLC
jgi:hypothetical protein